MPGLIRVVIADDQSLVREGIRRLLELSNVVDVVGEAADGEEAVALVQQLRPDVLLLDVRMPRLDGIGVLRRLGNEAPATLILTTFDDAEVSFQAIVAGARGYLLKNVTSASLIAAIEALAAGGTYFQPAFGETTRQRLAAPSSDTSMMSLTERETEVLRLMAAGHSNREIGTLLHMAEGTVKNHVSVILGKLAVRDRTRAVLAALERGLI
jgi:DNA-binding NarL/FixJ family response regulator